MSTTWLLTALLAFAPTASEPASAPAPQALLSWYNGVLIDIGTDIACGTSLPEVLVQSYVGFTLYPGNTTPGLGELYYAHIVIAHPGNPCVGGSAIGVEIILPPATQLAIAPSDPVFCFYRNLAGQIVDYAAQCPQLLSQGFEGYSLARINSGGQPWLLASGTYLEFLVPLRSSAVLIGDAMTARINPEIGVVGRPQVGVYTNSDIVFRNDFSDIELTLDIMF